MTDTVKLLPCPFCGGAMENEDEIVNENEGIANENNLEATPWYRIICRDCGVFTEGARLESDAIAAWNRRAPSSPPESAPPKCADCGAVLNEGEAKVFTVCDSCWNAHYSPQSRSAPPESETTLEESFVLILEDCSRSRRIAMCHYEDIQRMQFDFKCDDDPGFFANVSPEEALQIGTRLLAFAARHKTTGYADKSNG